jgi:tRNA-splicing ligase RtcB
LQQTIETIRAAEPDFFQDNQAGIEEIAVTPDFHKGSGVPIGTVLKARGFVCPQMPGKDVNCGMRLYTTDLLEDKVRRKLDALEKSIRHVFFEGGRQIPMTRTQRAAMLQQGLAGVLSTAGELKNQGLWRYYDPAQQERDLARVNGRGALMTDRIFGLGDFTGSDEASFDAQIGSIGGGNHFVEVQVVEKISDRQTAYNWGLKPGMTVVMVHSGSVSIGHLTGMHFADIVRRIYPKNLKEPKNKLFPLPASERHRCHWDDFWASFANAVNFAFVNRLFLGLMMRACLTEAVGEHEMRLLYDTGHNMIWPDHDTSNASPTQGQVFLHRKGACPARSAAQMAGTEFAYLGEPVIVPGSMGASSFLLAGLGSTMSLASASHGAGRSLSRGDALHASDEALREFLNHFRIVTPIDPRRADLRGRRDIIQKWEEEVKKEAPWAYKDISSIIETQTAGGVAQVVAELRPVLTAKG